MKPLAIDLFCGLGGWTDGLLAEGYDVIGYDIKEHAYGEERYKGKLAIQDVRTIHGANLKDAALIVASPPCQEYSYMAMPWSLAKAKAAAIRVDTTGEKLAALNDLFQQCFRIQREASFAAGHHIPMVVENVKGAQPWVGRARWNFGSFYLWGDVPALMPQTMRAIKAPGMNWSDRTKKGQDFTRLAGDHAIKNAGGSWFNIGSPGQKVTGQNPVHALSGLKLKDQDGYERDHPDAFGWKKPRTSSGSMARKAASALIAKIPLPLSRYIGATYRR